MRLRTPTFWYSDDGGHSVAARCLKPAAYVYGLARKWHTKSQKTYKPSIPVICIGNITAGGSGKTPTALAIYDLVKEVYGDNIRPCFLTRGYGGSEKGPIVVDPERHSAFQVGDEALLLAEKGVVIVSANRAEGAKLAENDGYNLIIMDDGMQNPSLHKDLTIVVVDGTKGFGNGLMLPAGPLREPLKAGLERTDAVLMIGGHFPLSLPEGTILLNGILAVCDKWHADTKQDYIAFAGLGHPEKFKDTLLANGVNVVGWHPYPDHYPYQDKDLVFLKNEAEKHNATLITTAKDAKRLPADFEVDVLPVYLSFEDKEPLAALIREILA